MKKLVSLLIAVFLMSMSIFTVADSTTPIQTKIPERAVIETLFTINIGNGEHEVGYSPNVEGIANDGPLSFTIDEDNNIYILDTLNKKIMVFKNTEWKYNIDISYTEHSKDIIYAKGYLYILDELNKVYKLNLSGDIQDKYNLPDGIETYMVEKLSVNTDGEIVIQTDGKEYNLVNGFSTPGYTLKNSGKKVSLSYDDSKSKCLIHERGEKVAEITFAEITGSIELLDGDINGNTYIAVQDDIPDSPLVLLEYTIKKLDNNGNTIGYARIPLEEYYNFPNRFVNITKDGEIYIMALKSDYVEIDKIILGKQYDSQIEKLKEKAKAEIAKFKEKNDKLKEARSAGGPGPYMPSRTEVKDRANAMVNLSWTYNEENASDPPEDVTKPDYLSGIESFPSNQTGIPYCWGGFDGVDRSSSSSWDNYLDAMSQGVFAGNVNCTGYYKSGTAGLDCSGFVSAAYTLLSKYNCTQLHDAGLDIPYDSIQSMDMFVKPGSHVLLFDRWDSAKTTAYSKEATTSGSDKTKNYSRTKSWLTTNGYYATTFWY